VDSGISVPRLANWTQLFDQMAFAHRYGRVRGSTVWSEVRETVRLPRNAAIQTARSPTKIPAARSWMVVVV
jgi:hypothetical protein